MNIANTITFFYLLFYSVASVAQTASPTALADDALVVNEHCAFSGTFQQSRQLSGLQEPLNSTGVLFFHCDNGVIWKTNQPVSETLVINKTGKSYRVMEGQAKPLTSRASKIMSRLIVNLISGDAAELQQQFDVARADTGALLLTPKQKRLKQAINSISLSADNTENNDSRIIEFTDRHKQTTRIVSTKERQYSNDDHTPTMLTNCAKVNTINQYECSLLFQAAAN